MESTARPLPWRLPLLLIAAGCTALGGEVPEVAATAMPAAYRWVPDPQAERCERVQWKQVARERIPGLCSDGARAARETVSCAIGCLVISPLSEAQARRTRLPDGETLYAHEARHVLEGLVHP